MQLEVFFDYACPYCYRGHKNLLELLPAYPELQILWQPCEAHPRPEEYSVHSDLAIQGMYFIRDNGGDLMKYHLLVFGGMFDRGEDISDPEILGSYAATCSADPKAFREALCDGRYGLKLERANRLAWEELAFHAVPSYRCDGRVIGSRDGIMVSKEALDAFLRVLT